MSPRPLIPHRRERILDEAETLILAGGFDAMSMQSLAERVGIAKGAIYREFRSKDQLLDDLLRHSSERLTGRVRALLGDDPLPRLSRAYRAWATALLDEPLMCAACLDEESVLGAYVNTVTDTRYLARHRAVETWVCELQRQGAVRTDVDPGGLALALSSATIGLLSAGKILGPLTGDQLLTALNTLEIMVEGLELPETGA